MVTYTELGMKGQISEKVVVHLRYLFTWIYKGKVFIHMEV